MKKGLIFLALVVVVASISYFNPTGLGGSLGAGVRNSEIAEEVVGKDYSEKTDFSGILRIFIEDVFEKDGFIERARYFVYGKSQVLDIEPTNIIDLKDGMMVSVSGVMVGSKLIGEVLPETQNLNERNIYSNIEVPTSADKKVAVFLINFLDSGTTPFTSAQARDIYFNGQFQDFYKEQSYEKISFSGTVFDWITLPRNSDDTGQNARCATFFGNGEELDPYISALNVNLNSYDHIIFQLDCSAPYRLGGMSSLGKFNYWYGTPSNTLNTSVIYTSYSGTSPFGPMNDAVWSRPYGPAFSFGWKNIDYVLAHEMGHSLGVLHANSNECGLQVFSSNCIHQEYGNIFDIMGNGHGFGFHMNSLYKETLGFLSVKNSIKEITQSGIYSIENLEAANSKVKAAKIKVLNSNIYPYYLEYRKAVGFDDGLNHSSTTSNQLGLFVNKISTNPMYGIKVPTILDMTPNNNIGPIDREYSLNGQTIFHDPRSGISIGPVVSQSSNSIEVSVKIKKLPPCSKMPLVGNMAHGNYPFDTTPGATVPIRFFVFDDSQMNCLPSKFYVSILHPAGWPSLVNPTNPNTPLGIEPGQTREVYAGSVAVPNVQPGIYTYNIQIKNTTNGTSSVLPYLIQVH